LPRIHRLPDAVVNRIAAGEVIERPASVVKELVENALDAGASSVVVEADDGGRTRLRVLDDGAGMSPDDARLALERHATSKIESELDLETIRTFGFRGEALPSIQSVSRFCLRTRPRDAEAGVELRSEGGVDGTAREVAMPPGTDVEVGELFFNVPARRKFLKSDRTESASIIETVRALALAHPTVRFTLRSNGRAALDLAPDRDAIARAYAVFGREGAAGLFPLAHEGRVRLSGLLGRPDLARRSPSGITLFVNRRWVRDRMLQRALADGYQTLLDRGTWPVAVLFLEIDPARVDVNVHPAKAEVRFLDGAQVFAEVRAAVTACLADAPWLGGATPPLAYPVTDSELVSGPSGAVLTGYAAVFRPRSEQLGLPEPGARSEGPAAEPGASPEADAAVGFFGAIRYVGQAGSTFLLGETATDLVLIDQHAAHERVTFQRLRAAFAAGEVASQRLLLPLRVELPPDLAPHLEEHAADLVSIGLHLRPFGDLSFVVEEVPALLAHAPIDRLVLDLADELRATASARAFSEHVDAVLSRMACHASKRAGDPLSREAAEALFRALDEVDFRANCPHGRPVVVTHSFSDVEKWFERT
jgi:DNA mismatch repair protein MutL